ALRTTYERSERGVFLRGEAIDANMIDGLVHGSAFEAPAQPLSQRCEIVRTEQSLETDVGWRVHEKANRRSGSASRCLARPSQVQRETNTASIPSRRCNWQIATPGSSA